MARANVLLGDEEYVSASSPASRAIRETGADMSAPVAPVSGGENIPRYVALMLLVALGVIVAVHFGGLRAMVTVGG
jgi:hypothetical protein